MALTVHEASERILAGARPLGVERIPLGDALGRVLADDVRSPIEHPPWDNSSMDGYAVRAADVARGDARRVPSCCRCSKRFAPASVRRARSRPNTAIRVMTGAPIPDGADSVIRVEDTDGGEERVAIRDARDARPQRSSARRGSHARRPRRRARHGARPGADRRARVGRRRHRRRCIGGRASRFSRRATSSSTSIDSTKCVRGDRIVSSNSYTLTAAVRAAGAEPVYLGIVADDPAAYEERLRAAPACDLLVTSGGVSVGAFDFTKDVLQQARRDAAPLARAHAARRARSASERSARCRGSGCPAIRCRRW